jgi:hypothetical protein
MSHLTILSHSSLRLAKLWKSDGTIASYDESKYYTVSQRPVSDVHDLSAALTELESMTSAGVIRGTYVGDAQAAIIDKAEYREGKVRKIKALYHDLPQHWMLVEVDKFTPVADPVHDPEAAITEYVTTCLPPEFQDISYHWQLSSSAGHPSSALKLKVHLWFWLSKPATSTQLKAWANERKLQLDTSVFNSVQFHYTAAPVAQSGVVIPVPIRSGLYLGMMGDEVAVARVSIAADAIYSVTTQSAPVLGNTAQTDDWLGITDQSVNNSQPSAPQNYPLSLSSSDADLMDDLLGLSPTLGWTIQQARDVLMGCNPDSDRATWVSDLAALHHETHGSAEGLELAVEWSSGASNFSDRKDVEDRWASFGRYRGNAITGKWLIKRRSECMTHLKYNAKTELAALLTAAVDEFALREKVCPQIAKDDRLDDMGREALAQMLFDSFKRLGTKYPIAQCRKLLAPQVKTSANGQRAMPQWVEGWVYVTNDDNFYRMDSEEWLTSQSFNARFNRELPRDEDGAVTKSATWVALDDIEIPTVTKGLYMPWAGPVFEMHGVQCVNTYRPSTTPTAVDVLSDGGRHAVSVIMRHLNLLAGNRTEIVNTMVDWMAHNVQKPGVKIRWAPLWKGIEGDGKTVMASLLASVMGRVNVRNVSPKVLGTDFTGWAEGAALVVLEEIKLTGHNRYDIMNALKPFITNDDIEVHAKGKDGHNAVNTSNYIGFTNYNDSLPLTETDRRWWIVFTPFEDSGQMARAVEPFAKTLNAYFDELHDVIQTHPAELRRWLLDHPISNSFKPNGTAPKTAEKFTMIEMSVTDDEESVRFVLEESATQKTPGVTPRLFSSSALSRALSLIDSESNPQSVAKNRLFSKMGFMKVAKKVKWNGAAHVVWFRSGTLTSNEEIRKTLDSTLSGGDFGEIDQESSTEKGGFDDLFGT